MERRSSSERAPRMVPVTATNVDLARALIELIAALDRRVPRVDDAGEASIAQDAKALREKAVKRLTELAEKTAEKTVATSVD
jgi:hypothetical protein